jgi:beta-phosphoglucomutase-like phosphatase (HAD superfamily)
MNWDDFDTALFDLDGVLTPNADVHMRAREQMFSEFLASGRVSELTTASWSTSSAARGLRRTRRPAVPQQPAPALLEKSRLLYALGEDRA